MSPDQHNHPFRLDRGVSAFFEKELEHIKTKTYDAKYKELKALQLIPVSTEAGNAANEITFRRYTGVGFAKIIADYAKDFPRVDVYGEEQSARVQSIGTSYGYSIQEIRASQRAGKRLDQRRAEAARRASDEKINHMAFISMPEIGTYGLLDYPGITEATAPADGTGSSKLWSTKTVDQIIRDISLLTDAVILPTYGREIPDTLLLPLSLYNLLGNTRLGDNETTLMKYIQNNNPHIKRIEWLHELQTLGNGGSTRVLIGSFDENHVTLELCQPFEQFDAEQKGMEFEVVCHSRCAGTIVYYPMGFAFMDGV
ncbi:hypothetical protein FACS1894172_14920 [Spirochaetia bacterium]|nr:hypothetical protein FACS1894172_14920 [Spirochaetia bacterium]